MTVSILKSNTELVEATWTLTRFLDFIHQVRETNDRIMTFESHCLFPIDLYCKQRESRRLLKVHANLSVQRSDVNLVFSIPNRTAIPLENAIKMKVIFIDVVSSTDEDEVMAEECPLSCKDTELTSSNFTKRLFYEHEAESYCSDADGSMTIRFKVEICITNLKQNEEFILRKDTEACETDALRDFQAVLNDKSSADVELKVTSGKPKSFYCHKSILEARSPVFRTMFNVSDIESDKKVAEIEVTEILPDAFEHFLSFAYSGRFHNISWIPSLPQLVHASVKFQLKSLKDFCDDNLMQGVNCRNVLAFARLAERHGLTKAVKEIRKYIAHNAEELTLDPTVSERDFNFGM